MVAIFTGAGTGFERGSGSVLGGAGLLGSAGFGRSGSQVLLNAANGNLLINRQDEFLAGRGPDAGVGRTYNSLGSQSDDNGDNWLQSTDRRVFGLTGTANSWGSTVKRRSGDGSEITYSWDGTSYVATDGAGSFDRLTYSGSVWTWTDGDSRVTETYAAYGNYWRITSQADTSGNALSYGYTDDKLTTLSTANGETLTYSWSGNHITTVNSGDGTLTRYFYDSYDRLNRVEIELAGGGAVYSTSYTYVGTSKLVATISETDGSSLTIGYDTSNRVTSLTQATSSGVPRTTIIAYGSGYTDVTDPLGVVTRLEYANGNLAAPVETWESWNLDKQPATIDGRAATQYTVQAGGAWSAASQWMTSAGETLTFALTLQAVGIYTSQDLGLYADLEGWGSPDISSARIVSGPGHLEQVAGGLWRVVGLSTTTGTRVEITRTYKQAQSVGAFFYGDNPGGYRTGASLIVADATLVRKSGGLFASQQNIANWDFGGVTVTPTGNLIDGSPASQLSVNAGVWAGGSAYFGSVRKGEQISLSLSLQAVSGSAIAQSLGLYGNSSAWGTNGNAVARIVSGPGTIVQNDGGLWTVTGLSATQVTRVEIVRTYDQEENAGAYIYIDNPGGFRVGQAMIAGAPYVARLGTEGAQANQLTKITTAFGTAQAQTVQFGYNGNGDLTSVTDSLGNATSYTYDANGNLLTTTDRLGNVVTRTYNAQNQLLTEARTGSDKDSAAGIHTARYVYDSANRLRFTISAEGDVVEYAYGGNGLLSATRTYRTRYDLTGLAASAVPTEAQMATWTTNTASPSEIEIVLHYWDVRGNLLERVTYGASNGPNGPSTAGGYTHEHFIYDTAGRLLQTNVSGKNTEYFVYDGLGRVTSRTDISGGTVSIAFNDTALQTVVTLSNGLVQTSSYTKEGELASYTETGTAVTAGTAMSWYDKDGRLRKFTDATGRISYYLYDAAGRKVADISQAGEVTEYRYDANDRLVATVRYTLIVGGSSTLTLLNDPNSTIDLASIRPAANASDIWTWTVYDKEGREIETIEGDGSVTTYEYDASGRLVKTIGYANKLLPAQISAFQSAAPTSVVTLAAHADDRVSRVFYDRAGRVIGTLNAEGFLTRTVYDGAGQKVQETAFVVQTNGAYRASGTFQELLNSVGTNSVDRTVRYVYDQQGYLRFTIDALNHITEYIYEYSTSATTAFGPVRQTVQYAAPLPALSSYTYTSVKNATYTLGNPANRTSFAVYDAAGRLAYSIDAGRAVIGYSYDSFGNVIRKTAYATLSLATSLPSMDDMVSWAGSAATASDRITRFYYNSKSELRYTVDAEGYVSRTDYDAEGRVTATVRWEAAVSPGDSWILSDVAGAATGSWIATSTYYDSKGRVTLSVDGEGHSRRYYYSMNGTLAWDIVAEGTPDESRTYYAYSAAGSMTYRSFAHGTAQQSLTIYTYNGLGDLISETDPAGHATTYTYDHLGRKLTQTDALEGVTRYQYDSFGDLVGVTDARGKASYSYYDNLGRVVATRDAGNFVTETGYTVFGEVEWVRLNYNPATNTASASVWPTGFAANAKDALTQFSYDKLGRLLTTTDAEGGIEKSWYDAFGGVVQFQNKLGGITEYALSRRGLLRYEIVAAVKDASGNEISASYVRNIYEYDARGNVVHQVEAFDLPERRDTWFEYDKANRLIKKWGEAVSVGLSPTTVTPTEYYYYDRRGNLIETVDAAGAHTYWVYDALNRKTAELGPTGAVRTWSYDLAGNLSSERAYASFAKAPATTGLLELQVRRMYDLALGRQPNQGEIDNWSWRMANLYPGPNAVASAFAELLGDSSVQSRFPSSSTNEAFIRSVYFLAFRREPIGDEVGIWLGNMSGGMSRAQVLAFFSEHPDHVVIGAAEMVEQQVAALAGSASRETSYTYDELGRLKTSSVAGQSYGYWDGSNYVYSSGTLTTTYDYDAVGNLVSVTDPTGAVTRSTYDSLNRRIRQVDAEGYITTWAYDAEGNVYHERRWALKELAGGGDPDFTGADRITEFEYDKMGRRIAERRFYVEAWSLNSNNGQLSGIYGTSLIRYTYNALGEVLTKTEARYEAGGVPQGPSDTTSYTYDNAGRLIMETRPAIALSGGGSDTPTIRYTYNALDQLTITRQGGASISPSDPITRNLYDGVGRLTGVVDALGQTRSYVYDAAGRKIGEYYTRELGNGASLGGGSTIVEGISYEYDLAGNLVGQAVNTISGGTWSAVSSTRSAYNAFGEITDRGTNVTAGSAASGWAEHFVYDTSGHLIRSNAGDGVWRVYAYDKAGRQTLSIESNGTADLSNMTQSTAVGLVAGGTVTATATMFDRRGQATQVVQMLRRTAVGGSAQNLVAERGYTAFGELFWERDALGRQTDYSYNTMGRVVEIRRPTVSVTAENGTVSDIRPTEKMLYDIAGRLIGTQDANSVWTGSGVRTTRQLIAGTGYGDSAALVAKEWHPDGGIVSNGYNIFGDLVSTTDEIGRTTTMAYDKLGQLTQVTRPATAAGTLVEEHSYDILGQRIGHWNNVVGYAGRERTEYDTLGRVTLQRAFGGDYTATSYSWQAAMATSGMGTFGGWIATTAYVNGRSGTEYTDIFGHLTWKSDLGGHVTTASYDLAGRMTERQISGAQGTESSSYTWLNNGQLGTVSTTSGGFSYVQSSTYDLVGNKLTEYGTRNSLVIQNATSVYDALNRLISWSEAGDNPAITPPASSTYQYDANSNVMRTNSSFRYLDQQGVAMSFTAAKNDVYRYDSMNRMVQGGDTTIAYDLAGQRVQVSTYSDGLVWTGWRANASGTTIYADDPLEYDGYNWVNVGRVVYTGRVVETYTYNADGQIDQIWVSGEQASANGSIDVTPNGSFGASVKRADYDYDLLGRVTSQTDYEANGTTVAFNRSSIAYNDKGQITSETQTTRQGNNVLVSYIANKYDAGSLATYALGTVVSTTSDTWKNGSDSDVPDTVTANGFEWWDGAVLSAVAYRPDASNTNVQWNTTYSLTAGGLTNSAHIADGRPRTVSFTLNAVGQVLRRDESDNNSSAGDPHQVWYRFNGREMGKVTNDSVDTAYLASINSRQTAGGTGPFRNGATIGQGYAVFGEAYQALTSFSQGSSGGSYEAQGGETLEAIATQLWGDSSLWYRLAEANGLSASATLSAGQRITIPTGVVRNTNTATTFKPYDPAEALGSLSPTNPKPNQKGNKCGMFGQILLAAIAIGVSALLPVGGSFIGLAISGAIGSAVSQGVGVATGIQDNFSLKGVAMAALSAGVAGGVSEAARALGGVGGTIGKVGDFLGRGGFVSSAVRGALTSAVTQGAAIAVGLQRKFDFAGVAAAGIGAGVGNAVGAKLGYNPNQKGFNLENSAKGFVAGMSRAIANAAARSLIDGTDFGDNVIAALPDTIGQTIGGALADRLDGPGANARLAGSTSAIDDMEHGTSHSAQAAVKAIESLGVGIGAGKYQGNENEIIVVAQERTKANLKKLSYREFSVLHSLSEYKNWEPSQENWLINRYAETKPVMQQQTISSAQAGSSNAAVASTSQPSTFLGGVAKGFGDRFGWLATSEGRAAVVNSLAGTAVDGFRQVAFGGALSDFGVVERNRQRALGMAVGTAKLVPEFGMAAATFGDGLATGNYGRAGEGAFGTGITLFEIISVKGASRLGSLTKAESAVGAAESGVWKLNPFQRGQQIEQALGHNLPSNFPTIDRFENGIATSIKSIDLDAASYLNDATLSRTLTGYVDKAAGFNGRTWAGRTIESDDILGRGLDLAIPHSGNASQQAIINQAVKYGATRGVVVKPVIYP